MTVVTFALPDESRDFRSLPGFRRPAFSHGNFPAVAGQIGGEEIVAVHTGVGDSMVQRERFARFLRDLPTPPGRVIISGFAGALRPGVPVGDLVLGENHSDPVLLGLARAALAGEPLHVGSLRTEAAAVETAADKAALHTRTGGALAVDMETAWVSAEAARAGVPTLSLRVISDAAGQDFPVPGGVMFDPVRQRPRYLALPAYLLTHPAQIGPFARFVRGLGPARARLAGALARVVRAWPGHALSPPAPDRAGPRGENPAAGGLENHLAARRPAP